MTKYFFIICVFKFNLIIIILLIKNYFLIIQFDLIRFDIKNSWFAYLYIIIWQELSNILYRAEIFNVIDSEAPRAILIFFKYLFQHEITIIPVGRIEFRT